MSTPAQNGPATYVVGDGVVIEKYRRLFLLADGTVRHAAAAEKSIGLSNNRIDADVTDGVNPAQPRGRTVSALSLNSDGTARFIASGVIAVGAELGPTADGKVNGSGGLNWVALNAAAADGDEVMAVFAK